MITKIRENQTSTELAVTGYLDSDHMSAYADRYFAFNDWSNVEKYAHKLLMSGLYVNIYNFKTGDTLDIDPDEYQAYFDGSFDINNDIVNFKRNLQKESKTMKEFVNNNTEEQELQEFLQWLKDENIKVDKVADKLKMIYLHDEKDLDEASFYLQDRDYFKKLYDFGWHVAVSNKSLGRKLAKTLKMESNTSYDAYDGGVYKTFDAEDARQAAKQVFDNVYSRYNKSGATVSEFQMDVELDTNKFWDTLTSLCSDNGFEYVIVSEDENFDDRYYTIKLMDVEEGYDVENECITESDKIGDRPPRKYSPLDRTYMNEFVDEMIQYFDGRTYANDKELFDVLNNIFGYSYSSYKRPNVIETNDDDHTGPFFLKIEEDSNGRIYVDEIYW